MDSDSDREQLPTRSAKFIVVTHYRAHKSYESNIGYSWGILLWDKHQCRTGDDPEERRSPAWRIWISEPAEQKNVRNVQHIDGSFLDTFLSAMRNATPSDLAMFQQMKHWVFVVEIPEHLFWDDGDIKYLQDICNYLRSHISGDTKYEIPDNIEELNYYPYEFTESEIL